MCAVYAPTSGSAQVSRSNLHGNAHTCSTCGATIVAKRGSRRQQHCSAKCRDAARRARNFKKIGRARYPSSGVPRSAKNSLSSSKASKPSLANQPIRVSRRRLIEIEVIAPQEWKAVTSIDGVDSWVAYLRPSPLVRTAR